MDRKELVAAAKKIKEMCGKKESCDDCVFGMDSAPCMITDAPETWIIPGEEND